MRRRTAAARPPSALLFGHAATLWHLPPMLARAGFEVDVVSVSSAYFRMPGRRRTTVRERHLPAVLTTASRLRAERHHDLVIPSDDVVLRYLRDWDGLPRVERLALSPVLAAADMAVLDSKVAMTGHLDASGVAVPPYRVATTCDDALEAGHHLGFPLLLKSDSGSGGRGVRSAAGPGEIGPAWEALALAHDHREAGLPISIRQPMRVLVQQELPGRDLDLSAIFRRGRLVHFTYSQVLGTMTRFGAATRREFRNTHSVDPAVSDELSRIGAALGLDGICNIAALGHNGGRFYFEVDCRPNLWTHIGAEVGDDPVPRLARAWGAAMNSAVPGNHDVRVAGSSIRGTGDAMGHDWRGSSSALEPRPLAATRCEPAYAPSQPPPRDVQRVGMAMRLRRRELLRNADIAVTSLPRGTADSGLVFASALLRGPAAASGVPRAELAAPAKMHSELDHRGRDNSSTIRAPGRGPHETHVARTARRAPDTPTAHTAAPDRTDCADDPLPLGALVSGHGAADRMYLRADIAAEEAMRRMRDGRLIAALNRFARAASVGGDPLIGCGDRPVFILVRAIPSADNETQRFVDLCDQVGAQPLLVSMLDDRYTHINHDKVRRARMTFRWPDRTRNLRVGDLRESDGRPVGSLRTRRGGSLADFHRALLRSAHPGLRVVDRSDWLRPQGRSDYLRFAALAMAGAVLVEVAEGEVAAQRFLRQRMLPGWFAARELFGAPPLFTCHVTAQEAKNDYLMWDYPGDLHAMACRLSGEFTTALTSARAPRQPPVKQATPSDAPTSATPQP